MEKSQYTLDTYVQELQDVVDYFSISNHASVNLIGHSFGAIITAKYLMAHPDKVNK